MAMACCHKECAEVCEILVCVDAPAPHNPGPYERLRFGLLSSSWLPRPLGIFLWSALHVMRLIVDGPVVWVLDLLTNFLLSVLMFGFLGITCFLKYVLLGLAVVPADLYLLACHESIVERGRGGDYFTVKFWKKFKSEMRENWDFVPIGVPCMSGSLYKETKDRKLKTWARWCEEVVHMHESIAL